MKGMTQHMKDYNTFTEAVEAFVEAADWLTDEDAPAVMAMKGAAAELDANGVQASLIAAYGVHYRSLLKKRPADIGDVDELDQLLDG